jgi:hypothetical protein
MAQPRLYPHQKKLNALQREKGIDLDDIDSQAVQAMIAKFDEKTKGLPYQPSMEDSSEDICDEIDEWLDNELDDEPAKPAPAPKAHAPAASPAPVVPEPEPEPAHAPVATAAPVKTPAPAAKGKTKVMLKDRMTKNDVALHKMYEAGLIEGVDRQQLKENGFSAGIFGLSSTGWNGGKYYALKKGKKDSTFNIVKLR